MQEFQRRRSRHHAVLERTRNAGTETDRSSTRSFHARCMRQTNDGDLLVLQLACNSTGMTEQCQLAYRDEILQTQVIAANVRKRRKLTVSAVSQSEAVPVEFKDICNFIQVP
jgi:hypothetical protein